ncbi:hypothetical protein [Kribbella sp. NPDC048915]|uniref:hypothetical protein n=1 Tax=Kribbella sp. NPDC048915 TaxID=3155148 RepID=UPI0033C6F6B3
MGDDVRLPPASRAELEFTGPGDDRDFHPWIVDRSRARRLAARTGLDPLATWEWGVVERVSTGLLCTQINFQPLGRDSLRAADVVAGQPLP